MTARFPARRFLTGLAASVVLTGCGPTPPQAPLQQAKKLDASTSDIATECGLTYQVTAFRGDHRKDLANLEAEASASVNSLASVYVRNPNWIYQGETVRQIVVDATEMLHECGLHRAERTLRRATSM
jgi:hypothetical protein